MPPRQLLGDARDLESREHGQHATHRSAGARSQLVDVHPIAGKQKRHRSLIGREGGGQVKIAAKPSLGG
jgi:hypothetical protein